MLIKRKTKRKKKLKKLDVAQKKVLQFFMLRCIWLHTYGRGGGSSGRGDGSSGRGDGFFLLLQAWNSWQQESWWRTLFTFMVAGEVSLELRDCVFIVV